MPWGKRYMLIVAGDVQIVKTRGILKTYLSGQVKLRDDNLPTSD